MCDRTSSLATYCFMMTSSNGNIFRVTGPLCEWIPSQRPVTPRFDVFFDLRLNKQLSKQSRGWWFETPSRSLWRHSNVLIMSVLLANCHCQMQEIGVLWSQMIPHFNCTWDILIRVVNDSLDIKAHGVNMGPTWGRQDPGGPHVGHRNLAIWEGPLLLI